MNDDPRFQPLLIYARLHFNLEEAIHQWATQKLLAEDILEDLHATLADLGLSLGQWRKSKERARGAAELQKVAENKVLQQKAQASSRGKTAADALHNKPGGTRAKQQEIRDIWMTGKYTARDVCAEQECGALNMSFSAARKALRRTPNSA